MKLLYALPLALIFFEGFISQCESAGGSKRALTNATRPKLEDLPIKVLENILLRTGFSGTKKAAIGGIRSLDAAKRIVKNSIIQIHPVKYDWDKENISEYTQDGDNLIKIRGVDNILPFFKNFGDVIKKIKVDYRFDFTENDDILRQINEKIIRTYAKQFTELHIVTTTAYSFLDILNKLSNGGERIEFLNVKKFVYDGNSLSDMRNSFDLNSIFPNLESLNFYSNPFYLSLGPQEFIFLNCMENVTKLKELKLLFHKTYIKKEIDNIFGKNKKLSSFGVVLKDKIDILHSIEKHLKTVETLEIYINDIAFLDHVHKNHQFKMPNLEKLIIMAHTGEVILKDPRITIFINSFKKLEKLDEIVVTTDYCILNMEDLIVASNLTNIKKNLGIFGGKNKLVMRMWVIDYEGSISNTCQSKVIEFNEELKQLHKPTWEINSYENHMTFLRTE